MSPNNVKTLNTQTLSVQLQEIAVKSKPMLANKFISIQFNRWRILWNVKCNNLFSTIVKLNTTLMTEVFPGTRKMERKEKPLKISCQNPVEHDAM